MAYAFAAMTYGFIGAYERGEEMAQHARARLNQPIPEFFRAWGWVLLARYYLIVVNLDAAVAAISASQMENHPERLDPATLFGVIVQGGCLLAQGEFERAVQLMENRVTIFRQLGFRQSMHDALFIQAKAMRALGKTERAIELLHQARIESDFMQARRLLWQIYATLSEIEKERGNMADAENYRAQAHAIVAYITDHTPPEFRESFLNLPDVRAVMN
jgi:tetratricopeptide (TPR) repeat protein